MCKRLVQKNHDNVIVEGLCYITLDDVSFLVNMHLFFIVIWSGWLAILQPLLIKGCLLTWALIIGSVLNGRLHIHPTKLKLNNVQTWSKSCLNFLHNKFFKKCNEIGDWPRQFHFSIQCFTIDVVTTYKIVMPINILDIPCYFKFSKVMFHQNQCYCLKRMKN